MRGYIFISWFNQCRIPVLYFISQLEFTRTQRFQINYRYVALNRIVYFVVPTSLTTPWGYIPSDALWYGFTSGGLIVLMVLMIPGCRTISSLPKFIVIILSVSTVTVLRFVPYNVMGSDFHFPAPFARTFMLCALVPNILPVYPPVRWYTPTSFALPSNRKSMSLDLPLYFQTSVIT